MAKDVVLFEVPFLAIFLGEKNFFALFWALFKGAELFLALFCVLFLYSFMGTFL